VWSHEQRPTDYGPYCIYFIYRNAKQLDRYFTVTCNLRARQPTSMMDPVPYSTVTGRHYFGSSVIRRRSSKNRWVRRKQGSNEATHNSSYCNLLYYNSWQCSIQARVQYCRLLLLLYDILYSTYPVSCDKQQKPSDSTIQQQLLLEYITSSNNK